MEMLRKAGPISCNCERCGAAFLRQRNRGNMSICSPCQNVERVRKWKAANPDRAKAINTQPTAESKRRYATSDRGKEVGREKARQWYWKDPDHARATCRARYAANRDREIQKVVDRVRRMRMPVWANPDAIAAIYRAARRLTEATGIPHQVDHIVPLNGETVSGLHVERNLQILTAEENRRKGATWNETERGEPWPSATQ